MECVNQAFHTKILSISQRQAVIKLIEKNDRDKRYIKNWRPVSLLNVDEKIVSKAISNKLKTALSTLISSQQTAYVINKFIAEKGRLISGITEISGSFNITYFLYSWVLKKLLILLTIVFLFPSWKSLVLEKLYYLDRNFIKRSTIVCHKWWNNCPIF